MTKKTLLCALLTAVAALAVSLIPPWVEAQRPEAPIELLGVGCYARQALSGAGPEAGDPASVAQVLLDVCSDPRGACNAGGGLFDPIDDASAATMRALRHRVAAYVAHLETAGARARRRAAVALADLSNRCGIDLSGFLSRVERSLDELDEHPELLSCEASCVPSSDPDWGLVVEGVGARCFRQDCPTVDAIDPGMFDTLDRRLRVGRFVGENGLTADELRQLIALIRERTSDYIGDDDAHARFD